MDIEDREHFKTIGSASVARPNGSERRQSRELSASRLDPASCLVKAQMICGCYRRDEAQNPDAFAAALALVLADYQADIVNLAVDPRTGVSSQFPMGLPNVGQIKQLLDDLQERQDRLKRYSGMPKPQRRDYTPPAKKPNLFVPTSAPFYEKMLAKAEKEPELAVFMKGHVCWDGEKRDGVMVPLSWWEGE